VVNLQQSHILISHHTLIMSLVKYECQKTGGNLKYVLIDDESESSIANRLRYDGVFYYNFIIQFAGERNLKSAKLQAKCLIVSYAPIALHFCPQYCRTRQISKITCVSWAETVNICCYIYRQINVSLLLTNIKLL